MAKTSRAKCSFLDWIGRLRRPFLPLLFGLICVFAVSPQMALVDTDDDGITDLSAIAIGASLISHPTSETGRDQRSLDYYTIVALAPDVIRRLSFSTEKADPIFRDRHSVLASLCMLRC
jgi:hypothetical protein